MNLTEKMALDCGIKIGNPFVDRLFMPLKNDNFIIFDTRSRYPNGEYDHFADVVEMIKPYLKQKNIDIFQITNENSLKLACERCFIGINKKQEAYLISKAKLVIANENYSLYLAATFNVKSIGLYSIFKPQNTQPVWNKDSQIVLESNRYGNLPTYNQLSESPKTINQINPFVIAKNILDSLKIQNEYHKYELVNIGKSFNQKIVELIPDFTTDENFLKNRAINLRLDYVDSLNINVFNFWLTNRKINIITDKDINLQLIKPFKNNIVLITIILSDKISETFLKQCKASGLQIKIFCKNKEKLNEFRFKFLNWNIDEDLGEEKTLKDLENLKPNSYFVSSKVLISKGKNFSCKANFLRNKILDNNPETVILSKDFEEELEFFKIYNEREESTISASRT